MVKIKNNNENIKEKIISFLKKTKIGETSTDIAKQIGHNRLTVSKYLEVLQAQSLGTNQEIAQAKLWTLVNKAPKPNILVVDDEHHVVNLIKLSLSHDKFNLFDAHTGKEALEVIKKNKIDLVLLDLMMPGMSGYEVSKIIKENPLTSHIHVIMLSAKGELKDKINGIEFGADDYMTKPFDPTELEARINLSLRYPPVNGKHPVTGLPTLKLIEEHVQNLLDKKQQFHLYNFKLDGLNKFAEANGYKKLNDFIVLFTRLVSDNIRGKNCFFGHTIKNDFVVVGPHPELDGTISTEFKKVLPYFDENSKKIFKLDVNKLNSGVITNNPEQDCSKILASANIMPP